MYPLINAKSNHPPNVTKEILKMINRRLNNISSSREVFEEAAPAYQAALKKSGYRQKLSYEPQQQRRQRRRKPRDIVYYNPPYNSAVKTRIGSEFLQIVQRHFGHDRKDKLDTIFNKHTVKLSYSCMHTKHLRAAIISAHNTKVLQDSSKKPQQKVK